jgi:quercetin dioxygenase-like cupin family protein
MKKWNHQGRAGFLAAGFCVMALAWGGTVAAYGQQPGKASEVIRLKTYPVKIDPKLGAGVAHIGEGRMHQVDITLIEIPPGKSLPPHHHMAEEAIYIVSGKGTTEMWTSEATRNKGAKYEWAEGDYLSPSLNAWHQHVNTSPDTPARILTITTSPLTLAVFDEATLSSTDTVFEDRWKYSVGRKPEYVSGTTEGPNTVQMHVGHILPDLINRPMNDRGEAQLGITITPDGDMAGNRLLEMEVREFKTVDATSPEHRHVWETVYLILKGDGYATLQREGEKERRIEWTGGDLFLVEANEYHNHRPLHAAGGRFLQIKPSGYFRRVGLTERGFLMQDRPEDLPR